MYVKKNSYLFMVFFLLFISSATVHAEQAIINTDKLNIRTGPGINYEKIGQLNINEKYTIIQQDGDWVELQLENETGWVTTEYITVTEDSNDKTIETNVSNTDNTGREVGAKAKSNKAISIQYDNTQIRNGPSTENDIIKFVKKGTKFDVLSTENDWYEIANSQMHGYVLKQLVDKKKKVEPSKGGLEGKLIVVDAGHGGRDVGSIGSSGTFEKHITYKTAKELKQELTNLGAEVVLTRTHDEYISLGSRASLSNNANTDAFISIHYNSMPTLPDVSGIGTYYYHDQSTKLASDIQEEIIKETSANDRGSTFGDFQVIRQNFKPAILVELGFLSNDEKERLLLTNTYQKKLVKGMIDGLIRYFATE